jgi:hypothetical protein
MWRSLGGTDAQLDHLAREDGSKYVYLQFTPLEPRCSIEPQQGIIEEGQIVCRLSDWSRKSGRLGQVVVSVVVVNRARDLGESIRDLLRVLDQ